MLDSVGFLCLRWCSWIYRPQRTEPLVNLPIHPQSKLVSRIHRDVSFCSFAWNSWMQFCTQTLISYFFAQWRTCGTCLLSSMQPISVPRQKSKKKGMFVTITHVLRSLTTAKEVNRTHSKQWTHNTICLSDQFSTGNTPWRFAQDQHGSCAFFPRVCKTSSSLCELSSYTGLNSAVMLMNLTRMRKSSWSYLMPGLFDKYRRRMKKGDQDLVNLFFHSFPGTPTSRHLSHSWPKHLNTWGQEGCWLQMC